MDSNVGLQFLVYVHSKHAIEEVVQQEQERRSLVQTATLLRTILTQQTMLESKSKEDNADKSTMKQDMSKIQHEKKLLESRVGLLNNELETWKKKASNQRTLEKENMTLKNQVQKLTTQLSTSKNETNKKIQELVTMKTALENKVGLAKQNIKSLKEKERARSPIKPTSNTLLSPVKVTSTPASHEKLGMKKPLVSNFSVSPFLTKRRQTTPAKSHGSSSSLAQLPLHGQMDSSTPVSKPILSQSTPEATKPRSPLKLSNTNPVKPSGLKNLISPDKAAGSTTVNGSQKQKKASLFDVDDDEDDDFFGNAVKKPVTKGAETPLAAADTTTTGGTKKRKKKIGTKPIAEEDVEEENLKFSPLKRVKLMDTLGGISPLKKRNKERGLFKV